ncbi:intraflagellar transport-associated protein isoform X3 [Sturnira hondurensis]|uniref:intraflagellar transport-associated protein isoform X3 n=1 Tax=Sturnira hondurensis TaxID=192404 RepID=UPI0018793484|nr:intraflagellar transport-associated protein isoform X3 [Sturnira hondurensis]
MPAQMSALEVMDEDQIIKEVLDKFVNCHEQTYEEFLSTFTHLSKDLLLLPGEVERDVSTRVPSHVPSMAQPLTPGVQPRPTVGGVDKHGGETLGDEVQPFHLDDEFDYDAVMLTPKFTPTEIDAIKGLSQQRRENTNTDLEEPRD